MTASSFRRPVARATGPVARPTGRPAAGLVTGVCLAGLACVAGCGTGGSQETSGSAVPVVASTDVYGDLAERIGGSKVSVTSLITGPGQDPHSYEADVRTRLAVSRAKIVIENGGGYDDFVDRMLKAGDGGSAPQVINAVQVSGHRAPADGELNEHVWYDFPAMARLADRITSALTAAAPDDAATFRKNADGFKAGLTRLEKKTDRIRAGHEGTSVAVTEPVPLYLTEASGLVNRAPAEFSEAVEEGDDVSPSTLQATLALFRTESGKDGAHAADSGAEAEVLLCNEQTSGPQTERVEQAARAAGVPVVEVTETLPAGKDYLAWMNGNVDALAAALAKAGPGTGTGTGTETGAGAGAGAGGGTRS